MGVVAAAAVASAAMSMYSSYEQSKLAQQQAEKAKQVANEQRQLLELKKKGQEVQAGQLLLQNQDKTLSLMKSQEVIQSSLGFDISSGSFRRITINDIKEMNKAAETINLNKAFGNINIDLEKTNVEAMESAAKTQAQAAKLRGYQQMGESLFTIVSQGQKTGMFSGSKMPTAGG